MQNERLITLVKLKTFWSRNILTLPFLNKSRFRIPTKILFADAHLFRVIHDWPAPSLLKPRTRPQRTSRLLIFRAPKWNVWFEVLCRSPTLRIEKLEVSFHSSNNSSNNSYSGFRTFILYSLQARCSWFSLAHWNYFSHTCDFLSERKKIKKIILILFRNEQVCISIQNSKQVYS